MLKWLLSTFAFIFLMIFVSAFTTDVFISGIDSGFDETKQTIREESLTFIDANEDILYSGMGEGGKEQIEEIEAIPVSQREAVFNEQCVGRNPNETIFCDERFISGESTLVEIMKGSFAGQMEAAQLEAFNQMNVKFSKYTKYPLILISIIAAVLSVVFYSFSKGILPGIQSFSGNVSWLLFLSSLTFKFMPGIINKILGVTQPEVPVGSEGLFEFTKEIMFAWLAPAMNHAFIVSISVAVIAFLIWAIIKIVRKYTIDIEEE